MKDCMFQYGTNQRMLADTGLITRDEAIELFDKNKDDFIERMGNDEEPQMVVWVNCTTKHSYEQTFYNWCADDFKVINGELYQRA